MRIQKKCRIFATNVDAHDVFAIPKRSPIRAKLGTRILRNILVPFAEFQSDERRNEGAVIDPIKCSYVHLSSFFFLSFLVFG